MPLPQFVALPAFTALAAARSPARGGDWDLPARRMSDTRELSVPGESDRDRETAWLRQSAAGDSAAFARLYDQLSRPLYAVALRILNDPTEAEDVLHDVFITLWDKASDFDPARGNAFSWAITLTRNRAIDRIRQRRRRRELLADAAPADLAPGFGADAHASPAADAADTAGLHDDAQAVRAAVAALPGEQRRALELAYFSGLTQQEIAEHLQQPLGTIKARIRRGLLKLRDLVAHRL